MNHNFLSILLSAVILGVTHLLLLNLIESNKRRVPSQNIAEFFKLGESDEEPEKYDDDDMKNELLNYVQEMSEKNNTSTKLEIKPDTEKVEGSNFYNKLSVADFGDNVYELDRFFKECETGNCQFTPAPTEKMPEKMSVKEPSAVDRQSHESLYLSKTNDEKIQQSSLEKITWKYDDERVMNGGELFNGIHGYNSMDDQYSMI
tara:strand:+ start:1197 stop:1805 length:609 start_codon:yes stop_codon:yes gene_type:complete